MEYVFILLFLLVASYLYFRLAKLNGIVDKPNYRSSHTYPVVKGGGVLFYLALVVWFFISNFSYPFFFVGASVITIVSFIDDMLEVNYKIRLLFQSIAVLSCLYQLCLPSNVILVLFFVLGVGFVNMYNFMDGINGMTGFYSVVVLLGILLINIKEEIIDYNFIYYVFISIIVFGFYNFRKNAFMFAGDIGSVFLGVFTFFILMCFIVILRAPVFLLFCIVYITDFTATLFLRIKSKQNVVLPHREHLYEKLVDVKGFSHLKVTFLYVLLQVVFILVAYGTYKQAFFYQLLIVFISFFCVLILYFNLLKKLKTNY